LLGQWAQVQVLDPKNPSLVLRKVDESFPLSLYLGVLGMPGHTAYFGLYEVAQFKKGDIVLVSGAAGAVGSLVGQLAKAGGAKLVVGSAGGAEKCKILTEKYGFDAAIDYKVYTTEEAVTDELKRISPEGYDLYYDNTGGHVSDAFYNVVRKNARAVICGSISNYNEYESGKKKTQSLLWPKLLWSTVSIRGFLIFDFFNRMDEADAKLKELLKEKKIKYDETIIEGFDKLPQALIGLYHGQNIGKMVVKV
jgi:NADPH-dependent curcumin reductase CurA